MIRQTRAFKIWTICLTLFTLFSCIPPSRENFVNPVTGSTSLNDEEDLMPSATPRLSGDPGHIIGRATVEQLFSVAPVVSREDNTDNVFFMCSVYDGTECYYVAQEKVTSFNFLYDPEIENDSNRIEQELAYQITRELGVAHLERAKYNTVILHCTRDADQLACRINGGGDHWYPVEIQGPSR